VPPGGRNCLVALNKMTGAPGWTSTGLADKAGHSSAIVVEMGPAALIVQITGRAMVGLDAPTGRMLWRNERAVDRGIPCCTPVHADGYCFGATGYGKGGACVKLSAGGGGVTARQVWDTKDMICHHGGYVVHDGHIYGNHLGGWSCLELTTGRKKWYSRGVGKGSLCYADGMLYTFGESRGRMGLVRATPSGFEQTGEFSVAGSGPSWAHPVVTGGRLYLRYHDKLYCFDVRGPNYREAPVVKPVPRPRPATRPAPVPRPPPPPSDAASDAAAKLKVARVYLNAGLKDKAKAILTDLVKRHPDTDAAKEAQAELDRLD